jgi:RNA polymerase sigma-70 factor (ECF subfamily)
MDASSSDPTHAPKISWEEWLGKEAETFFLYARQQTRSESDAKDVLQETLTEIWTKSNGSVPDRSLVFATIRRRAIDLGRSLSRRSKREFNYISEDASWFTIDYASADTEETLAHAIMKLPDHLREVLILKLWGEMTFPKISELTGVSTATATSRYRYALEHLRKNEQLAELKP